MARQVRVIRRVPNLKRRECNEPAYQDACRRHRDRASLLSSSQHSPNPEGVIASAPGLPVPLRRPDEWHPVVKNLGSHRFGRVGPAKSALILQNDGVASVRRG